MVVKIQLGVEEDTKVLDRGRACNNNNNNNNNR
jgi:hypothetical protein